MAPGVVCVFLGLFAAAVAGTNFKRTVIAIHKKTSPGEYVFLRGGGAMGRGIPIKHNIRPTDTSSFFYQTSQGDTELGWNPRQFGQGAYRTPYTYKAAEGTPMMWTSSSDKYSTNVFKEGVGYWFMNTGGEHFWIVDVDMDCSGLEAGMFAFKGYLVNLNSNDPGWEDDINGSYCHYNTSRINFPYGNSRNHMGFCGHFNIVRWNSPYCQTQRYPVIEKAVELLRNPPLPEIVEDTINN